MHTAGARDENVGVTEMPTTAEVDADLRAPGFALHR
jgi:hypothetical protein